MRSHPADEDNKETVSPRMKQQHGGVTSLAFFTPSQQTPASNLLVGHRLVIFLFGIGPILIAPNAQSTSRI